MVLDWRAPVSRAFYRASARDPQGVAVRRRFGFSAGVADQLRGRAPRPRRGARHGQPDPDRRDRAAARRADARHRRHHPARAGRAGPRRPRPTRSACRARPAPARPPSACTAPRTCSTCTANGCAAPACSSSAPTARSCRYISAVLPALGEVEVEQSTVDDLIARVAGAGDRPAGGRRGQARRPDGDGAGDGARGAHRQADRADRGLRRLLPLADRRRAAAPDRRRGAARGSAVRHRPRAGPGPRGRRCCSASPRRAAATRPATPWLRRMAPLAAGRRVPRRGLAGRHAGGARARAC